MFGEEFYPKLANVQSKIVFLKNEEEKIYIYKYIYIHSVFYVKQSYLL